VRACTIAPESRIRCAKDEECSAIGRDPNEIRRSAQLPAGDDPAELVDRLSRYHQAGFTELVVMLSGGSMPTAKDPARLAAIVAEKVLPQLRQPSRSER